VTTTSAAVYVRDKRYFVHAYSITVKGIAVASDPFFAVESKAGDESLGAAVESALMKSRTEVPDLPASARHDAPLLKLAKVRSWREFMRGAKYLAVVRSGKDISIERWDNDGFRTFEPSESPAAALNNPSKAALGARIREILAEA